MARRLVIPKLVLGSIFSIGPSSALLLDSLTRGVLAQPPSATAVAPPKGEHPEAEHHAGRPDRDGRRGRGGRGRGGELFIFEAVRRDGGPLEFMPLLMHKGIRQQIGSTQEQDEQFAAYFAEMQKRLEDERKQAESDPNTDWPKLFKDRLDKENSLFQAYLSSLPPQQLDRLIGVFVQHRNLRALSNRVVTIDRLGLPADTAQKLQNEIHAIREETMRESNEEMRRLFTEGGANGPDQVSFQQLVRKNQAKVDSRIEKLVDRATLAKLKALRGDEVPRDIMDNLDTPPMPPGRPPGPPPEGPPPVPPPTEPVTSQK